MTQALDEATHRIHRYLLLQLIVNASYGLVIGVFIALYRCPAGRAPGCRRWDSSRHQRFLATEPRVAEAVVPRLAGSVTRALIYATLY
jgi:hypothetical protein